MKAIAREALETFEPISNAAQRSLGERGITLNALASINEMTASNVAAEMQQINDRRRSDWVKLRREPAIARLVVADEDNSRETLYISSGGTVGLPPNRLIHVGAQAPVNNAPPNPTWTVGFIKSCDINSLFARVRVLPLHFWGVGSAVRGRGFSLRGVR